MNEFFNSKLTNEELSTEFTIKEAIDSTSSKNLIIQAYWVEKSGGGGNLNQDKNHIIRNNKTENFSIGNITSIL